MPIDGETYGDRENGRGSIVGKNEAEKAAFVLPTLRSGPYVDEKGRRSRAVEFIAGSNATILLSRTSCAY